MDMDKDNVSLTAIVYTKSGNYVQISNWGRYYNCTLIDNNGEKGFYFKRRWYAIDELRDEHTTVTHL